MERARMAPGKKEAGTIGIRWTACPQEEDVVVVVELNKVKKSSKQF